MKFIGPGLKSLWIGIVLLIVVYGSAQDTLNVMYYNILNYPGSTASRVNYFRTVCAYTSPDVILVNEILSDNGAITLLQNGLNVYGKSHYQKALFTNGDDTDNMLFYNSDKLILHSQDTIDTQLRLINEYILYYKTDTYSPGDDTTFFYFYSCHLKASSGSTNEQKRLAEVLRFKQHIDALPNPENIIFGGDFNVYDSAEPAYQSLINDGLYPLIDPLPAGDWHNDPAFASIHTQSTRTAQFGGGATGGMDDRFDFILYSNDVTNGQNGVTYIDNSCYAFGNDGNHFNIAMIDPPVNSVVPDSVVQALYYMSDHLPVLCLLEIDVPEQSHSKHFNLELFLEGPFVLTEMTPGLLPVLPLDQPYDQAPWNYNGGEFIDTLNNPDIIDWILIEIRQTYGGPEDAHSDSVIWQSACLLTKSGKVVDTGLIHYPLAEIEISGNLYAVVRHRNHLDVMSGYPLSISNDTCGYSFHSSQDAIYGLITSQVELSPGIWAMSVGDCDGDGTIQLTEDKNLWSVNACISGYESSDLNFDKQVNNLDKVDLFIPNINRQSVIPD